MTAWERFVTSVKHACFYSHWLQWDGSSISWKRSGCVPKQHRHPGEFLYKWSQPNTWARLKRSFSADCSSLTARGNEVKPGGCELCRNRRWRRWGSPGSEGFGVPSAGCVGRQHSLMASWFRATQPWLKLKSRRAVNSQVHSIIWGTHTRQKCEQARRRAASF